MLQLYYIKEANSNRLIIKVSYTRAGRSLNAAIRAVGATKQTLINGAFKLIKRVGFNVSKTVVTSIVGAVWNFAGLSIGGLIARGIDRVDCRRNNGYCFG